MAGSIGAMNADEEDDITEDLLADAGKLTGLSLELLGLDPHPDDMTPEQRLQFEPEDLDEMAAVSPEDRKTAVNQTPCWQASCGTRRAFSLTSSSAIWGP